MDVGVGGAITTVIAIDKDRNSQYAVKWALENVVNKISHVTLIHVLTQTTSPHGDGIGMDGRSPTEGEMQQLFLPFRAFCACKGVRTKEVVLEDTDVSNALIVYINTHAINNLVVGSPTRIQAITRAFKSSLNMITSLQRALPDTCNLYVVSKTKSHKIKSANSASVHKTLSVSAKTSESVPEVVNLRCKSESVSGTRGSRKSSMAKSSGRKLDFGESMLTTRIDKAKSISGPPVSNADLYFDILDKSQASDDPGLSTSSQNAEIDDEICRVKMELKKSMDAYHSVCNEARTARLMACEIEQLMEIEKQKSKVAIEAAHIAQRLAELEALKRQKAEQKAEEEAEERKKLTVTLTRCNFQYRKYTIEDIEIATDYFSNSLKIGEGGYGPVFKGYLDHITVAIKVLRPDISQGPNQFQQEVEILSCIRHPHMVLLLGACPEYGCLVYEYMENGSFEDRLLRKNNTPPISWSLRFKICCEIATALHFLHQTRPKPLVHRDIKPGNILLDGNYVSKISDVGLARLIPPEMVDDVPQYHITAAAGTFCYIDPEYQQSGVLGTKSDVYSFGVILLQVITAKRPMGLTHLVSRAVEEGSLVEVLDPDVTDWPVEDTLSLAKLALQCCELRKKDRPDLGSVILPELKRLRDLGDA
ncbi:U-box domain-containing protein 52 [Artemisia annua]|uniref:RING-type E3 ubiquitin transferase n=1 Tax=Artemisia annua TaxID=35608 RepID=A0A2U1MZ60_ARTAN|nr:U-box domain-containing protein 52 [Artemisia annua]PWA97500.1 U-box domain-containing protein 52 [Artemisia annua]